MYSSTSVVGNSHSIPIASSCCSAYAFSFMPLFRRFLLKHLRSLNHAPTFAVLPSSNVTEYLPGTCPSHGLPGCFCSCLSLYLTISARYSSTSTFLCSCLSLHLVISATLSSTSLSTVSSSLPARYPGVSSTCSPASARWRRLPVVLVAAPSWERLIPVGILLARCEELKCVMSVETNQCLFLCAGGGLPRFSNVQGGVRPCPDPGSVRFSPPSSCVVVSSCRPLVRARVKICYISYSVTVLQSGIYINITTYLHHLSFCNAVSTQDAVVWCCVGSHEN